MLSNRCLSCLSDPPPPKGHSPQFSTHICCGQMAGWMKMPLGRKVGLDPSVIVLDGDQAPPPKQAAERLPPNFRSMHIVAKRLYGSRCHLVWRYMPRPRPHCARWAPGSPPEKGAQPPPQFSAHVCFGQKAGWIKMRALCRKVGLGPGHIVLHEDPVPQKGAQPSPQFSAHVYCGQTVVYLIYC